MLTLLGYSVEEWLTTPNFWLSIVHPEDKERAALDAAETFASRKARTNRFRWIVKDGKVIWVEVKLIAVRDEAGSPTGMRGVAMDISELRQSEELRASPSTANGFASGYKPCVCVKDFITRNSSTVCRSIGEKSRCDTRPYLNADETILDLSASAGLDTRLNGTHARIPQIKD